MGKRPMSKRRNEDKKWLGESAISGEDQLESNFKPEQSGHPGNNNNLECTALLR